MDFLENSERFSIILYSVFFLKSKRIAATSRAVSLLCIIGTILSEELEPQTKLKLPSASYLILNAEIISK